MNNITITELENKVKSFEKNIKIMLSPSEKLLYNLSHFFGVKLGFEFAQDINAELKALACNRCNMRMNLTDFEEYGENVQEILLNLKNK